MNKPKDVTIYDIARRLNVSIATVSRALKDDPVVSKKTKKQIEEMAREMGYRYNYFAGNLRSQTTRTIGVIIPRLNSYFMSSVIAGMEQVANNNGYNLIISQTSESGDKELVSARTMFNTRVDGLLVSLAYDTTDLSHFEPFYQKNIPVLFFDRVVENSNSTCILIDNRKAAFEVTEHLIAQGKRRIVHVTAKSERNVYTDRITGYRQALAAHRIKFREEYIIYTNLTQESGAEVASQIRKMKPMPDAVFAANDNCAVGCMLAMKQAGFRIPEDIAFAGFNNDPVSKVIEPNLTTIHYPGYEMGQAAAMNLINHLNGSAPLNNMNTIWLRHELMVRGSSGGR